MAIDAGHVIIRRCSLGLTWRSPLHGERMGFFLKRRQTASQPLHRAMHTAFY
jgi:hypothetical protein